MEGDLRSELRNGHGIEVSGDLHLARSVRECISENMSHEGMAEAVQMMVVFAAGVSLLMTSKSKKFGIFVEIRTVCVAMPTAFEAKALLVAGR